MAAASSGNRSDGKSTLSLEEEKRAGKKLVDRLREQIVGNDEALEGLEREMKALQEKIRFHKNRRDRLRKQLHLAEDDLHHLASFLGNEAADVDEVDTTTITGAVKEENTSPQGTNSLPAEPHLTPAPHASGTKRARRRRSRSKSGENLSDSTEEQRAKRPKVAALPVAASTLADDKWLSSLGQLHREGGIDTRNTSFRPNAVAYQVKQIAFRPNAPEIITSLERDGTVRFFSLRHGRDLSPTDCIRGSSHSAWAASQRVPQRFAWSPQGDTLALLYRLTRGAASGPSASSDRPAASPSSHVYRSSGPHVALVRVGNSGDSTSPFSPSSSSLLSPRPDTIRLPYDATSPTRCAAPVPGAGRFLRAQGLSVSSDTRESVEAIAWMTSSDGSQRLLTAERPAHGVVLWKPTASGMEWAGENLHHVHASEVNSMAQLGTGPQIVSGGSDGVIVGWDVERRVCVQRLSLGRRSESAASKSTTALNSLAVVPARLRQGSSEVWSTPWRALPTRGVDGRWGRVPSASAEERAITRVTHVEAHPCHPSVYLAALTPQFNQRIFVLDCRQPNPAMSLAWPRMWERGSLSRVIEPHWSPDGNLIGCGSSDPLVHLWDVRQTHDTKSGWGLPTMSAVGASQPVPEESSSKKNGSISVPHMAWVPDSHLRFVTFPSDKSVAVHQVSLRV